MPNIGKVIKEEIQRLSKKEVTQAVTNIRKQNIALKKEVASHKKRIAALEKHNKSILKSIEKAKPVSAPTVEAPEEIEKVRITGKTLKSMRSRLGITQKELARLLDVSHQIIQIWEQKTGGITFRKSSVVAGIVKLKIQKKDAVWEELGKEAGGKRKRR